MSTGSPDSLVAHSFVPDVAIVGGGPAGLMAAEVCAGAGLQVAVFDAMPSVGRKFLLAGKGGLNLTHSEPLAAFETRFGPRADVVTIDGCGHAPALMAQDQIATITNWLQGG